jgi:hypothetical protein
VEVTARTAITAMLSTSVTPLWERPAGIGLRLKGTVFMRFSSQ